RMHAAARELAEALDRSAPGSNGETAQDAAGLLRWLADGHFTFLGYRHCELVDQDSGPALQPVLASGLGVLRGDNPAAGNLMAGPDPLSQDVLVLTQA